MRVGRSVGHVLAYARPTRFLYGRRFYFLLHIVADIVFSPGNYLVNYSKIHTSSWLAILMRWALNISAIAYTLHRLICIVKTSRRFV